MTDEQTRKTGTGPVRRWWWARSVAARKTIRTLILLVVTCAASLGLGLATATASSPVGPHQAHWSTTLDSRVTIDLGPLGTAFHESPAGFVGVRVVLGEIPTETTATVTEQTLGQSLSADGSAYRTLLSRPDLTIRSGLHALAADALRRAGVVEALLLCLVAAGRLATDGRLRDTVLAAVPRGHSGLLVGSVALTAVIALVVPSLRPPETSGVRLSALEGTAWAQAHFSGRLADILQAYGPPLVQRLETNTAFYNTVETNLEAAWQASQELEGRVDITAVDGAVDRQDARERAEAADRAQQADPQDPTAAPPTSQGTTPVPPAEQDEAAPSPQADQEPAGSPEPGQTDPSADDGTGAGPDPQATAASAARAVAADGSTTVVLTTDLHCNLDVIAISGRLDALADADIHLDDGDLTMTGSEPEQVCVDALNDAVPHGVAKAATIGNHDSEATAERLRANGWTVTNGRVQEVGGLRILGDIDADRSPAGGTYQRGAETSHDIGARLAGVTCEPGADVDVVLIHQPATFGPLISGGCAPLLVAGHVHQELGMTVTAGGNGPVAQLVSGAGKGGTSVGPVTEDAYLHVMSFDAQGRLLGVEGRDHSPRRLRERHGLEGCSPRGDRLRWRLPDRARWRDFSA